VVTDSDGHSNAPGNLVIAIADDTPIARSDTDAVTASQLSAETGNVITGAGTTSGASGADVQGADGGLSIVGVAAGNGTGGANPGTVGAAIVGAFGALTLNADGSYSYARSAGGGSDAFTYTIRDADGSLSHATLTFNVGDSAPGNIVIPPAGNPAAGTEVFEAGLAARNIGGVAEPAGSHTGNPAFPAATAGTITFGFGRAAVGRGLADAGICQNGLRNRIIDQERLRAVFADDIVRGPDTFFGKRIFVRAATLDDRAISVPVGHWNEK
jgi:hypothetical protein